jgi:uncharacterized protein YcfL
MNWKLAIGVAALGFAVGCSSHKGAYVPVTEPHAAHENVQTVVLLEEDLEDLIAVEGQKAQYTEDGRLQVFANLRNREEERVTIQVQTMFKDENGFSTGDETAWETIILTELSQTTYQSVAMNNKARKYTIRIRSVR